MNVWGVLYTVNGVEYLINISLNQISRINVSIRHIINAEL
jgi:hypothetical protein